jgi:hypothetical protein
MLRAPWRHLNPAAGGSSGSKCRRSGLRAVHPRLRSVMAVAPRLQTDNMSIPT